jgi:peroxiredoxin
MAISRLLLALSAAIATACATSQALPATIPAASLLRLEGEPVSLQSLTAQHDATVLVWWARQCPCVARYEARIKALREHYPEARLGLYPIDSNADDDPESIGKVARNRRFTLPILRDPGGRLASALNVRSTPTVLLVSRDGSVLFRGWIDNEREPEEPDRLPYLQNAIDGYLAGRTDFARKSPIFGCPITQSLTNTLPESCHVAAPGKSSGDNHVP